MIDLERLPVGLVHWQKGTAMTYGEMFDEYLDEVLDVVRIGGLTYGASHVLKAVDPIAYREEFLSWLDLYYPGHDVTEDDVVMEDDDDHEEEDY